ncbi:MAG: sugar phosphate nucleotidyltransferase [Clostridia bacterium]|nr:sugar phosphate nucleotidyltransferase [Clostridia bacterium]
MLNKAVILAAGRGTRFLPYTKGVSKEMLAVVDVPALYLVVDEVVKAGIHDICIVISPDKQEITRYFSKDEALEQFLYNKNKLDVLARVQELSILASFSFVYQNQANGSGDALNKARKFCNGQPAVVLNADDIIYTQGDTVTKQLCDCFNQYHTSILGVQEVDIKAISKYASCHVVKSNGRAHLIDNVIEKPTPSQVCSLLAPLGRYVISEDFFEYIDRTPISANGELQFTDSLQLQAKENGIYAYEFIGKRYDTGDKLGYIKAFIEYALRDERFGKDLLPYLKQLIQDNA